MINLDFLELKNKVQFLNTIKKEIDESVDKLEKKSLYDFYFKKSIEMNDYIQKILKVEKEFNGE